ncbi:MAG: hypothetical protein RRY24_05880 [Clostridiales bacterium]
MYPKINEILGAPTWEVMTFGKDQSYFGTWENSAYIYALMYNSNKGTQEEKCSVGFSITDKAVFDKNGKLPVPSGELPKVIRL